MNMKKIFFAVIAAVIVILCLMIVLKMTRTGEGAASSQTSGSDSGTGSAADKKSTKAVPMGTDPDRKKLKSSEKDLKIQRLANELRRLNAGQAMIPQMEGIVRELCDCGNDAVIAMKEILSSDANASVKAAAARVLAQLGTAESVGILVECINSESSPVNKDLYIRALQAVDRTEASPALIKGLETSKDIFMNTEMKQALARTGNEDTVKQLVEACHAQKGANSGKENLLGALSLIRHPDSLPALSNAAANDQDPMVRKNALRALSNMGNENSSRALVEMLQSGKNDERKSQILDAISSIKGKESIDYLRGISDNSNFPEDLRKAAARAVFTIKNGVPPAD
ncbi:MAG TPA: hypothetical protein DCZ94_10895 [Lentisphaeria bacterium]|nr:MAG: hypothetical protein A2X48_06775 [Lentisphaerae bacterium GWF2_49_21]HBC87452.1 hypothetical protein [Lentisphaeria bacterium]